MRARILVAGIGNIFLGDDGFGVEVVRRLAQQPISDGVTLKDFGIRGMDLVYALLDPYDAVIFVDTATRGEPPGTLYLIEHDPKPSGEITLDTHGMDPVKVLALARALGAGPVPTYIVACEPQRILQEGDGPEVLVELTPPVLGAIDEAARMVRSLIERINATSGTVVPAQ